MAQCEWLEKAGEEFKPVLLEAVKKTITAQFNRITEVFGPKARNVANSTSYGAWAAIRGCAAVKVNKNGSWTSPSGTVRPNDEWRYELDPNKLDNFAQIIADQTFDGWKSKISSKLEELQNPKIHRLNNLAFQITGMRQNKRIEINQSMIINVSNKGKLFNQFPARIYVDGNFTSEKAYKEQFKVNKPKSASRASLSF